MTTSAEHIESLMLDAWMGNLSASQRVELDSYLASHPDFAEEQQALSEIWEGIALYENQIPSPQLTLRFDAMLNAYESGLQQSIRLDQVATKKPTFISLVQQLWRYRPNLGLGLQMGLSFAMLLMGVFVGRALWSGNGMVASPAPTNNEVAELRGKIDQLNRQMALTMLQQSSATDRLQGIQKVRTIAQPSDDMTSLLIQTLNNDPSLNVRLAVVEALTPIAMKDASIRDQLKEAFIRQDSPMVQAMMAEMFVQTKEKSSAQLIEKVIESTPDPNLREHFAQSIKALND